MVITYTDSIYSTLIDLCASGTPICLRPCTVNLKINNG